MNPPSDWRELVERTDGWSRAGAAGAYRTVGWEIVVDRDNFGRAGWDGVIRISRTCVDLVEGWLRGVPATPTPSVRYALATHQHEAIHMISATTREPWGAGVDGKAARKLEEASTTYLQRTLLAGYFDFTQADKGNAEAREWLSDDDYDRMASHLVALARKLAPGWPESLTIWRWTRTDGHHGHRFTAIAQDLVRAEGSTWDDLVTPEKDAALARVMQFLAELDT